MTNASACELYFGLYSRVNEAYSMDDKSINQSIHQPELATEKYEMHFKVSFVETIRRLKTLQLRLVVHASHSKVRPWQLTDYKESNANKWYCIGHRVPHRDVPVHSQNILLNWNVRLYTALDNQHVRVVVRTTECNAFSHQNAFKCPILYCNVIDSTVWYW